ncbi:hypothetical protein X474_11360 [Dethiosulfatarculus sandiegensis]|uniref:Uncharacterized protein n=1 Tax=Dethiosulfatarculus sandiegensis TaxID=1429043 RepID=A0A0D2JDW4_9BACT|nr:hypothetical protein X474_11360 [Dethiosulfatarculus sandiegensis]
MTAEVKYFIKNHKKSAHLLFGCALFLAKPALKGLISQTD